ncbi:Protein of unknown function [Saccharicrinis carchari]|uniref:DUF2752 domain-containing protein n=2 Tax=Saccharicrinis carchari TaxID=1168039 RepID=A0A521D3H1_SACCC|nr:Protein of unknown function [Saccharicrinis carchari]
MTIKTIITYFKKYFEAIAWVLGLGLMAWSDPYASGHYSLCLIKNSGIGFCPGCGLGHAIGFLARGELLMSFKSHPLGIFAVIILSFRIFRLFKYKHVQINADEQNH